MFRSLTALFAGLLVGFASLLGSGAAVAAPRVALVTTEIVSSQTDGVRSDLLATGRFDQVDVISASAGTPSLATLQAYHAVLVWYNTPYSNRDAFGDVLADYVDSGGGVVIATYANAGVAGGDPGGRFLSGGYALINFGGRDFVPGTIGTIALPGDPIMAGVTSIGPLVQGPLDIATLAPGAILVASWSNGAPLAVKRTIGAGRRVDVGFYPPGGGPGGIRLLANALVSASPPAPTPVPTLSEWAMILLGLTLAGGAALVIQRRRVMA